MGIRDRYTWPRHGSHVTQGKWCFYCGCELQLVKSDRVHIPNLATIDHLTPRCRGGHSTEKNSVECCVQCNNAKGQLTLAEYRIIQAYRAGQLAEWQQYKFWAERPAEVRHQASEVA